MARILSSLCLQVTFRCNIECDHCGPRCGPGETEAMTAQEMKRLIQQAAKLGALSVVFTGGEPSLLGEALLDAISFARNEAGMRSARVVTNASFASSYEAAHRRLKSWRDAGLEEINISCGEYHARFVPEERIGHAFRAAESLGYATVTLAIETIPAGTVGPHCYLSRMETPLLPLDVSSPYLDERRGTAWVALAGRAAPGTRLRGMP